MVRKLAIVAGLAFVLAGGSAALAQNKCDAGISKALGKKVACKCGVYAKGQQKNVAADTAKLAACSSKFSSACAKAKTATPPCALQTDSCTDRETDADTAITELCNSSPSGAFLN